MHRKAGEQPGRGGAYAGYPGLSIRVFEPLCEIGAPAPEVASGRPDPGLARELGFSRERLLQREPSLQERRKSELYYFDLGVF
ncbi:MAG TPA: hypothetical protein VIM84_04490 [Gemmatimonadales bacterium]